MNRYKSSTQEFHYCLSGVPLTCEIYWEEAEERTHWEPGCAAQANVEMVMCGDMNITELLSDDQRKEIETAFLEQEVEV